MQQQNFLWLHPNRIFCGCTPTDPTTYSCDMIRLGGRCARSTALVSARRLATAVPAQNKLEGMTLAELRALIHRHALQIPKTGQRKAELIQQIADAAGVTARTTVARTRHPVLRAQKAASGEAASTGAISAHPIPQLPVITCRREATEYLAGLPARSQKRVWRAPSQEPWGRAAADDARLRERSAGQAGAAGLV